MHPYDEIYGAEPRRFLRFVIDIEVEVTDPTQTAAYLLERSMSNDEAGQPGMVQAPNQNQQVISAVSGLVSSTLHEQGARVGVQWLSSGPLPRQLGDDGQYKELLLPSMPARRDDGTFEDDPTD